MLNRRGHLGVLAAALVASLSGAGCAARLPTHAPMSSEQTIAAIADRAETVRTINAIADVALTDADGRSIRLQAAIAARPLDRMLRVRAWKFDRAVFDLTVIGDEAWLAASDDPDVRERISGDDTTTQVAFDRLLVLLGPEFIRHAVPTPAEASPRMLTLRGEMGAEPLFCEIDRPTLTVRRFWSAPSAPAFAMDWSDHRLIGDVPFPTRFALESAAGRVVIELRDVELNADLAQGAFTPPKRAAKLR